MLISVVLLLYFSMGRGNEEECTTVYERRVVSCHEECSSDNRRPYFVPQELYPPGALQAGLCVSEDECVRLNSIQSGFDHYELGRWICPTDSTCIPKNRACDADCYEPSSMKLVQSDCKGIFNRDQREEDRKARQARKYCLVEGMTCSGTCEWSEKNPFLKTLATREKICSPFCDRINEWQCGSHRCISKKTPCHKECPKDYFFCEIDDECIPLRWVCDGSRNLGCSDKSDERECGTCADGMARCEEDDGKVRCKTAKLNVTCNGECSLGYFKCGEKGCVTARETCERKCMRKNMFKCGNQCFEAKERCDGLRNCADGSDEVNCGECKSGSVLCGERLICKGDFCEVNEDPGTKQKRVKILPKGKCECDHYWCSSEERCVPRDIRQLQTCDGLLDGHPSIDQTVFKNVSGVECDAGLWEGTVLKQGSCLPDDYGRCPTSFRISDDTIRLWSKCGGACWSRDIEGENIPPRYDFGICHYESFNALCSGKCKYYNAWFCVDDIICTDRPCEGKCPKGFYLCKIKNTCIPEDETCGDKCIDGKFRCGTKCLYPNKVCDGVLDCSDGTDEKPSFCKDCSVGQGICEGKPLCLDQKCNGKCQTKNDGTSLIDCKYESERNICSIGISSCLDWMNRRYG